MQRLFTLLIILLFSHSGYSQSKVPVIFEDFTRMEHQLDSIGYRKTSSYSQDVCIKGAEWEKDFPNDSSSIKLNIESVYKKTNTISVIYIEARSYKRIPAKANTVSPFDKPALIILKLLGLKHKSPFSSNLVKAVYTPVTDNLTSLKLEGFVGGYQKQIDKGPIEYDSDFTRVYIINPNYPRNEYDNTRYDDSKDKIFPNPAIPDSTLPLPVNNFTKAFSNNGKHFITFIEGLFNQPLVTDTEKFNDYVQKYYLDVSTFGDNGAKEDTLGYTIHFSLLKRQANDSILNFSIGLNTFTQGLNTIAWKHYKAIIDTLFGYFEMPVPASLSDAFIYKYIYVTEDIYPYYGYKIDTDNTYGMGPAFCGDKKAIAFHMYRIYFESGLTYDSYKKFE